MTEREEPRVAGSGCRIETVTTADGLAALEHEWNRVSKASPLPNVFTTFDWFRVWHQRYAREVRQGERRLNVVVVRRDGAVTGICPLVRVVSTRFGLTVRRLEFVGHEWDYNDLLVGDGSAGQTEAVADHLVREWKTWDVIDLRHVRESGDSIERLERAITGANLLHRISREAERCPYMPIDAPWSAMLARRSPSTRHRFRHQQGRIDRLGKEGLRVRIIENPQDEPGLLDRMIALEAQKHVGGELSPPFLARYPDVFRSLFETLGPQGWLAIALMELGARPLASHLLFRCGDKIWGYLTAYDHEYAHLSPGTMLVPAIVDYGFARGFREYDFGNGEEPYKQRFTTDSRQIHRVQIWSRRLVSRLRKFAYFDLRPALSRWRS